MLPQAPRPPRERKKIKPRKSPNTAKKKKKQDNTSESHTKVP